LTNILLGSCGCVASGRAAVRADRILLRQELEIFERHAKEGVDDLPVSTPTSIPKSKSVRTYDGTGSANASTKSTGPLAHPFDTMRSNTSLTVLSMYGCIDLTFSGVNHDSTMPLIHPVSVQPSTAPQPAAALPMPHMLGRVHIHKGRSLLASSLAAITELGEPRP
jgi:hypothetical protein